MKLTTVPTCGSRKEYLALLAAICTTTPEPGERDDKLFNALQDCLDCALADISPNEMAEVLSAYRPPAPSQPNTSKPRRQR